MLRAAYDEGNVKQCDITTVPMAEYGPEPSPRPWDDPADLRPLRLDTNGRITPEFADWVQRQGHRRWLFYFGPEGTLIDDYPSPRDVVTEAEAGEASDDG